MAGRLAARHGSGYQKSAGREARTGHPTPARARHHVQFFDEEHHAAMLDAGDAVSEASAEAARLFHGEQRWRAALKSNLESRRTCSRSAASPCSESCAASSATTRSVSRLSAWRTSIIAMSRTPGTASP